MNKLGRFLEELYRIEAGMVAGGVGMDELMSHLVRSAMSSFGADSSDIVRYDPASGSFEGLQSAYRAGLSRTWVHSARPDGAGARALATGARVWFETPEEINPVVWESGIRCVGAFPLQPPGRPMIGVLYLHYLSRPSLSAADLQIIDLYAHHAGLLIELLSLRSSLERRLSDLEQLRSLVHSVAQARDVGEALCAIARHARTCTAGCVGVLLLPYAKSGQHIDTRLACEIGLDGTLGDERIMKAAHALALWMGDRSWAALPTRRGSAEEPTPLMTELERLLLDPHGAKALLAMALAGQGRRLGVMVLCLSSPHAPPLEEVVALETLCDAASSRLLLAELLEAQRTLAQTREVHLLSMVGQQLHHRVSSDAGRMPIVITRIERRLADLRVQDSALLEDLRSLRLDTEVLLAMAEELRTRRICRLTRADIVDLVRKAATCAGPYERWPGMQVELRVPSHPVGVDCAEAELIDAISNLFVNAAEAGATHVLATVVPRPDVGMVEIAVADDGCGIEQDAIDRLWVPFYTTKRRENGHRGGQGLWIARQLISNMGGEIAVSSQVKVGSLFTIRLPLASSNGSADLVPPSAAERSADE